MVHFQQIVADGNRRFQCPDCSVSASTRAGVRAHHSEVHGERQFQCIKCMKWFARKPNLIRHELTVHKLQLFNPSPAQKPVLDPALKLKCYFCPWNDTTDNSNRNRHMHSKHTDQYKQHQERRLRYLRLLREKRVGPGKEVLRPPFHLNQTEPAPVEKINKPRVLDITMCGKAKGKRNIHYHREHSESDDPLKYVEYCELNMIAIKRKRTDTKFDCKSLLEYYPVDESRPIFDINGFDGDIRCIITMLQGAITTAALDAYLSILIGKYNNTVTLLPCEFFPSLKKDEFAGPFFQFLPPEPLKNILIAPMLNSVHFYLAVFNFSTKTVTCYDSSKHHVRPNRKVKQVELVLDILMKKYEIAKQKYKFWTCDFFADTLQQWDDVSCGYMLIMNVERILRRQFDLTRPFTQRTLLRLKVKVFRTLLNTTEDGKRILWALTK